MLLFSNFDYRRLAQSSLSIYVAGLLGLLVVLLIGHTVSGSKSWLSWGGVSLQPSEFVKWIVLLFVAHRLGTKSPEALTNWDLVGAAGLLFFPMFLVLKQPDLGVAMTYTPILLLFPLLRGIRWRWVVAGVLGFALLSTVVWNYKLKTYQKERILTFIDPSRDLKGKGYQVNQSRIAIGAGGLWGRGFMSGSQTQLNFLPVKTTDFVFSVWAEERGFVGILIALALFGVLLHRILGIARDATTLVGSLLRQPRGYSNSISDQHRHGERRASHHGHPVAFLHLRRLQHAGLLPGFGHHHEHPPPGQVEVTTWIFDLA